MFYVAQGVPTNALIITSTCHYPVRTTHNESDTWKYTTGIILTRTRCNNRIQNDTWGKS